MKFNHRDHKGYGERSLFNSKPESGNISFRRTMKIMGSFYLIAGLIAGLILWGVEGFERTWILRSRFISPTEGFYFFLYFALNVAVVPFTSLLLTASSLVRKSIMIAVTKLLGRSRHDLLIGVARQTAAYIGLVLLFSLFGFLALYFLDDLFAPMAAFLREKELVKFDNARTVLMLRALFIAVIAFVATVCDELADTLIRARMTAASAGDGNRLLRFIVPVLALGAGLLLASCYYLDSRLEVSRHDQSFHLPLFISSTAASLILGAISTRYLLSSRRSIIPTIVVCSFICFALLVTLFHFGTNQNVKSLFWRRGVIAKRYLGMARVLMDNDEADFIREFNLSSDQKMVLEKTADTKHAYKFETESGAANRSSKNTGIRNIIFLTIDTLRADHMGVYGYRRNTTPNLDELAGRSLFCEHAYSAGTNTGHSFAAIFRSVMGDGMFDKAIPTLPGRLADNGYYTAVLTGPNTSTWLNKKRWSRYKEIMFSGFQDVIHSDGDYWDAKMLTDRSIDFLQRLKNDKPFFVWIHYTDPHSPYDKHSEFDFGDNDRDRYDGEIAYTDKHIDRLIDYIDDSGLSKNTLVVFTSDHGEGFGCHGATEHGSWPFGEQNFIPLWFYSQAVGKARITKDISHLDIAPTILDTLNISKHKDYEGVSIIDIPPTGDSPVITETPRNIPGATFFSWALMQGRWKIIYDYVGSHWQLYDLQADPKEKRNIADTNREIFQSMKEKLSAYIRDQSTRKNYSSWERFD